MDIQTKEDCILSFKNKLCFAINTSVSNLDRFREKKTTTALKIESSLSLYEKRSLSGEENKFLADKLKITRLRVSITIIDHTVLEK
jgi:hypothetical protein